MGQGDSPSYLLNDWVVDPQANRLQRGEENLQLEAKTMDVLAYLLANADRVVSTEELLQAVWPDRVVEQSTVHRRINQIRAALADDAKSPTFIKTIVRRGYQIVATVSVADTPADSASPESATPFQRPTEEQEKSASLLKPGLLAAGVVVVLAAVGVWLYGEFRSPPASPADGGWSVVIEPKQEANAAYRIVAADLRDGLNNKDHVRLVAPEDEAEPHFRVQVDAAENQDTTRVSIELYTRLLQTTVWSRVFELPTPLRRFEEAAYASTWINRSILGVGAAELSPDWISLEAKRFYAKSHAMENPLHARRMLEQAVEADPRYWPATGQLLFTIQSNKEREKGLELARTLLEQQPQSLFNLAVAKYILLADLDYEEAWRHLEIARDAPRTAEFSVNFWRAAIRFSQGNLNSALSYWQQALAEGAQFDQTYSAVLAARCLNGLGNYRDAALLLRENLYLYPAGAPASSGVLSHKAELIKALAMLGEVDEANALLDEHWAEFRTTDAYRFPHLFVLLKREDEARELLNRLEAASSKGVPVPAYNVFEAYVHLGEFDAAVAWLHKLVEEQDVFHFGLVRSAVDLQAIRELPGYKAAMQVLAEKEARGTPLAAAQS